MTSGVCQQQRTMPDPGGWEQHPCCQPLLLPACPLPSWDSSAAFIWRGTESGLRSWELHPHCCCLSLPLPPLLPGMMQPLTGWKLRPCHCHFSPTPLTKAVVWTQLPASGKCAMASQLPAAPALQLDIEEGGGEEKWQQHGLSFQLPGLMHFLTAQPPHGQRYRHRQCFPAPWARCSPQAVCFWPVLWVLSIPSVTGGSNHLY